MNYNFKFITILLFIIFVGCNIDGNVIPNDELQPNVYIAAESTAVQTFELVLLKASIEELNETYQCTFGTTDIILTKVSDSTLVFVVPDIENGDYQLKTDLGNIVFTVSKTVVPNVEASISAVFKGFDDDINALENSKETADAKLFKTEVDKLYNSLTSEQKVEVAMYYEANKEIFKAFKENLANTYDAPTTYKRSSQSTCPKTDYVSFYSCTAQNLTNSISELGGSLKNIAEPIAYAAAIGKLAYSSWALGPAVWGLTAVGASLTIGTAMYILITEVKPAFIEFVNNLVPFLKANWIFPKAVFAYITDDFDSGKETDLELDIKFRSIAKTDSDISAETSNFISAFGGITKAWDSFAKVLGDIPSFTTSEEPTELKTEEIVISNISNSNVELESQNGQKVKFKSLSGNQETFSFDITVKKEGFTRTTTINATITGVDPCLLNNAPIITSFRRACDTNEPNLAIYKLNFKADGVGFTNNGSYYGAPYEGTYPVRLEFRGSPTGDFQHASNSYIAYISDGDIYEGEITIEFDLLGGYCSPLSSAGPVYWWDLWKVYLIDDCGKSSNTETFQLFYYNQ